MGWSARFGSMGAAQAGGAARQRAALERGAWLAAALAAVSLAAVFGWSKGVSFLMPGPLSSAHGSIEACSSCHSQSGNGKLSWLNGLTAGERHADSKACLACHKMPETAFNAHGAQADVLEESTQRLARVSARLPPLISAEVQNVAFPAAALHEEGIACATCHKEHKGRKAELTAVSEAQCRSCHVLKFDSFEGHHPKFEGYPFERRTRIVYDHAAHFGKHYPEVARKDPSKHIPQDCAACHDSREGERVMPVAPFESACSGCHLDQIVGESRATGPKGVGFLTVPGLDLATLKSRKAEIGEWPVASEAPLTPFMKVMIGRSEKGRAVLKALEGVNLQNLSAASAVQIEAVAGLAKEVKALFFGLISGKASEVLGSLDIADGATLSPALVSDLTASLPREVVVSAQQQWLPGLGREIGAPAVDVAPDRTTAAIKGNGPGKDAGPADGRSAVLEGAQPNHDTAGAPPEDAGEDKGSGAAAKEVKRDPPACVVRVFGQCLVSKGGAGEGPVPADASGTSLGATPKSDLGQGAAGGALTPPMRAGLQDAGPPAVGRLRAPLQIAQGGPAADGAPAATAPAADTQDELLFPTDEERRAIDAHNKASGRSAVPAASGRGTAEPAPDREGAAPAGPALPGAGPVLSIKSEFEPEAWAEYGGWYAQDYAISYRPAGHKDKFMYAWLYLTGPKAAEGPASPAAGVFEALTGKDAQGACTKCHSVDDIADKGRLVNFRRTAQEMTQGRFTRFVHAPHLGVVGERGCLACHTLQKGAPYLKNYEGGDPKSFAAGFGAVQKDLCQTCHNARQARQDCLLCHTYHVNGVRTPAVSTRLPQK